MANLDAATRRQLALTIAGEIHPGLTRYGSKLSRTEIANILETINTRSTTRGLSLSQVVHQRNQYSTWNDAEKRATAKANYAKYATHIDSAIQDYFDGKLPPTQRGLTNYYSPSGMKGDRKPNWDWDDMQFATQVGPHRFYVSLSETARKPTGQPTIVPMSGSQVRTLQKSLNAAGFLGKNGQPLTVDGAVFADAGAGPRDMTIWLRVFCEEGDPLGEAQFLYGMDGAGGRWGPDRVTVDITGVDLAL